MKKQTEINFTKTTLLELPIPSKGKIKFHDTKEKGLSLYVTATGHKSFMIRRRIKGQQKEIILGHFPDMTVELARKAAQKIKGQIAEGKNPCEEKEKIAAEKTFGEAFELFIERYAKIEKKEKQVKEDERQVNRFLQRWFMRPLSSITKNEVEELHDRVGRENGKYESNRLLERIRSIYNKMINWGLTGINPTTGIYKFKEHKRDRFILHDELPKFMEALEMEPNRAMRDFFLICLYTGARCGNVLSMRWEDIDFSINEWRILDTKNGEPVRIPLIGEALEILDDRSWIKVINAMGIPRPWQERAFGRTQGGMEEDTEPCGVEKPTNPRPEKDVSQLSSDSGNKLAHNREVVGT